MILAGLVAGYWIKFETNWIPFGIQSAGQTLSNYLGLIGLGTSFLLGTFFVWGVYDRRKLLRFRQVGLAMMKGMAFWFFAYLGVSLVLKFEPPISRIYVACSCVTVMSALLGWRWAFHKLLGREAIARKLRQRIVFIGWSREAGRMVQAVKSDRSQPYHIAGFIPSPFGRPSEDPTSEVSYLGESGDLASVFEAHKVDMVVLADLDTPVDKILSLANLCEREFIQFKIIPSYFQILVSGLQLDTLSGVPILGISELPLDRPINQTLKRAVDVAGSVVGLTLSAPLLAICGALVYLESPGSIFYRQLRVGRNGRNFHIIKVRSMRQDAEVNGGAQWAKKDDPRRLKVGAFIRAWNIDEIPQFWNVLKGEMSLVGPRPERPELIANFKHEIPHYNARHASKPGMTGWAQINGLRGDTDLRERVRYDLFYLENWSLWLDFQIMFQTFIRRDNAY